MLLFLLACSDDRSEASFDASPPTTLDLLWIIDDSLSMGDQQTRLAEHPAQWFYNFDNFDLHAGITTTSAWTDPDKALLTWADQDCPNTAACFSSWQAALQPGVDGSDIEQGYGSAFAALEDSRNEGFLRDGALHVIAPISTDDDCTGAGGDWVSEDCYDRHDELTPTADMLPRFFDFDRGGRWEFSGMVGPAEGCSDASAGVRYLDMIEAMGGVAVDICTAGITDGLEDIARMVMNPARAFVMPEAADPASFTVYVDDREVPNDPNGGWTYDEASWVLLFHGMSTPLGGSEVVVRYNPA